MKYLQGVLSRFRSWSQENLHFAFWRRSTFNSPDTDNAPARQEAFQRGTVSLGHGGFRRSRRGGNRKVDTKTSPSMNGLLIVQDERQEWTERWCVVKQLTFYVHETAQHHRPMDKFFLPGSTVTATDAHNAQDRIIEVKQQGSPTPLLIKVCIPLPLT